MRAVQVVLVGLLALLLVGGGALLVSADDPDTARGEPDIEAFSPETAFVPGQEATLSVTLNNRGDIRDRGDNSLEDAVITARAATAELNDSDVPFTSRTETQAIGDVGEGTTDVGFTVVPDQDAEAGVYEVPIELEYRHTYYAEFDDGAVFYDERIRTETVTVDVEITDRAQFAVVDTDGYVQAGDAGTVDVTLRNVANQTAHSAMVTASAADSDVTFVTDSGAPETFVEEWAPNETRTIEYRLEAAADATDRQSTLEFDVDYRDEDGPSAGARTARTGIVPIDEQSFSAEGIESTLRVDDDGSFTANVTNDGPKRVTDVVVVFDNEAPAVEGVAEEPLPTDPNVVPRDTQVTVGDLDVGETATVGFEAGIRSDAAAGDRTLNVAARYRNAAGDLAVSDPLDVVVPVTEERDQFAVEAVNRTTEAGTTNRYEATVTNTGDEPVRNVQAKLFVDDPLDTDDDEAFVTDLDPGESETVVFDVDVDGEATEKVYDASIDFRYDDVDGDSELSDTYRLPADVVQPEEESLLEEYWLVGVLGGVGLLLAVAVWQRGRLVSGVGRIGRRVRGANE